MASKSYGSKNLRAQESVKLKIHENEDLRSEGFAELRIYGAISL